MLDFAIPEIKVPKLPPILEFSEDQLSYNGSIPLPPFDLFECLDSELHNHNRDATLSLINEAKNTFEYNCFLDAHFDETSRKPRAEELLDLGVFKCDTQDAETALEAVKYVYPMHWVLYGYAAESPADSYKIQDAGDFIEAFRTTSLKDVILHLFGTYRKDLAKAVVKSSQEALMKAWIYSPFIPIDYVIDFLNVSLIEGLTFDSVYNVPAHRFLLEKLSVGDCKRLLWDTDPLIDDTVLMWADNQSKANKKISEQKKIKSTRQLHDMFLSLEQGKTCVDYSLPDGFEKLSEMLNNILKPLDLYSEPITNSRWAADVGSALKNCAGSKHNRELGVKGALGFLVIKNTKTEKEHALASFRPNGENFKLSEIKLIHNVHAEELEQIINEELLKVKEYAL